MKKITLLVVAFVFAMTAQAQTEFSFETSEGFTLGNINGQNGWISTPIQGGGNIDGIVVSDEHASDGDNSLEIPQLPSYGPQETDLIGARYIYESAQDRSNLTISFDLYFDSTPDGSGSEFTFQQVNNTEGYYINWVVFDPNGAIVVLEPTGDGSGNLEGVDTGETWTPETFFNFRIELDGEQAKYYVDDALIYQGVNWADYDMEEVRFGSNNVAGNLFIDNYSSEVGALGVKNISKAQFTHYVNNGQLNLSANAPMQNIAIYNMLGQQVVSQELDSKESSIGLSNLSSGIYLSKININGKTQSFKFVKN